MGGLEWPAGHHADEGIGSTIVRFRFMGKSSILTVWRDAPTMVGPDARVGREPGQVRKEAAISALGPVPSVARPWSGRLPDFSFLIFQFPISPPDLNDQSRDPQGAVFGLPSPHGQTAS